jgi:RNA polymerase sigma-70 factor (ECF subfamily)
MDELTRLAMDAAGGEPAAAAAFIRATQAQVRRLCARLVDEQSADDLVQEAYLRAFRALPGFRGDSSARTWLLSIAHRTCMDELRTRTRQRRRDALLFGGRREDPVNPDTAEEIVVNELLARLRPERRAAFVLTQMHGLSYEQTAEICGCPVGTVRSRVARARSDLIALLTPTADKRIVMRHGPEGDAG